MKTIQEKLLTAATVFAKLANTATRARITALVNELLIYAHKNTHPDNIKQQIQNLIDCELDDIRKGILPYNNYQDRTCVYQFLYDLHLLCASSPIALQTTITDRWQECAIRLEQHILDKNIDFIKTLGHIKTHVETHREQYERPTCLISYSWPLLSLPQEFWIQSFLELFAKHLECAGVQVDLDITYSRWGNNTIKFMNNIKTADYVILIGTESLKIKNDVGVGMVCFELNLIRDKNRAWKNSAHNNLSNSYAPIIPLLLSGSFETSFPADFRTYHAIEAFVDTSIPEVNRKSYFTTFKMLLNQLYRTRDGLNDLWDSFTHNNHELIKALDKPTTLTLKQEGDNEHAAANTKFKDRIKTILSEKDNILPLTNHNPLREDETQYITLCIKQHLQKHYTENTNNLLSRIISGPISFQAGYIPQQVYTQDGHPLTFEQLLAYKAQHTLITGSAGSGKTTWMQNIAIQWATNQAGTKADLLIWIKLKNLTPDRYPEGKLYTLADIIITELTAETDYRIHTSIHQLHQFIDLIAENTTVLLDGLDNLPTKSPCTNAIEGLFKNKKLRIITTGRPYTYKKYNFDNTYILQSFTAQNIPQYIHAYFDNKAIDFNALEKYYSMLSVGQLNHPLTLEFFCYSWQFLSKATENNNITLTRLTAITLHQYINQYLQRSNTKSHYLQQGIEIISDEQSPARLEIICTDVLLALEKIAFEAKSAGCIKLDKIKFIIDNLYKSSQCKPTLDLEFHIKEMGLVTPLDKQNSTDTFFEFPHETLLDHLTAKYWCKLFTSANIKDQTLSISHFTENIFNPRYEMVWWFAAGILSSNHEENFLEDFFALLTLNSKNCIGYQPPIILLRCLSESDKFNSPRLRTLKEYLINIIVGGLKVYPFSQRIGLLKNIALSMNSDPNTLKYILDKLEPSNLQRMEIDSLLSNNLRLQNMTPQHTSSPIKQSEPAASHVEKSKSPSMASSASATSTTTITNALQTAIMPQINIPTQSAPTLITYSETNLVLSINKLTERKAKSLELELPLLISAAIEYNKTDTINFNRINNIIWDFLLTTNGIPRKNVLIYLNIYWEHLFSTHLDQATQLIDKYQHSNSGLIDETFPQMLLAYWKVTKQHEITHKIICQQKNILPYLSVLFYIIKNANNSEITALLVSTSTSLSSTNLCNLLTLLNYDQSEVLFKHLTPSVILNMIEHDKSLFIKFTTLIKQHYLCNLMHWGQHESRAFKLFPQQLIDVIFNELVEQINQASDFDLKISLANGIYSLCSNLSMPPTRFIPFTIIKNALTSNQQKHVDLSINLIKNSFNFTTEKAALEEILNYAIQHFLNSKSLTPRLMIFIKEALPYLHKHNISTITLFITSMLGQSTIESLTLLNQILKAHPEMILPIYINYGDIDQLLNNCQNKSDCWHMTSLIIEFLSFVHPRIHHEHIQARFDYLMHADLLKNHSAINKLSVILNYFPWLDTIDHLLLPLIYDAFNHDYTYTREFLISLDSFLRKYPTTDTKPLITILLSKLKSGNHYDNTIDTLKLLVKHTNLVIISQIYPEILAYVRNYQSKNPSFHRSTTNRNETLKRLTSLLVNITSCFPTLRENFATQNLQLAKYIIHNDMLDDFQHINERDYSENSPTIRSLNHLSTLEDLAIFTPIASDPQLINRLIHCGTASTKISYSIGRILSNTDLSPCLSVIQDGRISLHDTFKHDNIFSSTPVENLLIDYYSNPRVLFIKPICEKIIAGNILLHFEDNRLLLQHGNSMTTIMLPDHGQHLPRLRYNILSYLGASDTLPVFKTSNLLIPALAKTTPHSNLETLYSNKASFFNQSSLPLTKKNTELQVTGNIPSLKNLLCDFNEDDVLDPSDQGFKLLKLSREEAVFQLANLIDDPNFLVGMINEINIKIDATNLSDISATTHQVKIFAENSPHSKKEFVLLYLYKHLAHTGSLAPFSLNTLAKLHNIPICIWKRDLITDTNISLHSSSISSPDFNPYQAMHVLYSGKDTHYMLLSLQKCTHKHSTNADSSFPVTYFSP